MPGFVTPGTQGRPGEVHTSAKNPLGMVATGTDGYEYVYLKGVASTVLGSWVVYDEAGVSGLLDVGVLEIGPVAIATAIVDAVTEWGWYGRRGAFTARVVTTLGDDAKLYGTATAGDASDDVTAGKQIHGAISRSTDTSNLATVEIHYPFVGVTDAII